MKESMYIRDMVIRKQHEVWPPRPRPQRKKTEAAKRSRGDEVEGKKKSELRRSLRITASLHSSRCAAPSASTASEEKKTKAPTICAWIPGEHVQLRIQIQYEYYIATRHYRHITKCKHFYDFSNGEVFFARKRLIEEQVLRKVTFWHCTKFRIIGKPQNLHWPIVFSRKKYAKSFSAKLQWVKLYW